MDSKESYRNPEYELLIFFYYPFQVRVSRGRDQVGIRRSQMGCKRGLSCKKNR